MISFLLAFCIMLEYVTAVAQYTNTYNPYAYLGNSQYNLGGLGGYSQYSGIGSGYGTGSNMYSGNGGGYGTGSNMYSGIGGGYGTGSNIYSGYGGGYGYNPYYSYSSYYPYNTANSYYGSGGWNGLIFGGKK